MAEYEECPDPRTNIVFRRLATPREAMFGLRTDGTARSICSIVEILSKVEIGQEVLVRCAQHFNSDIGCFEEFLMEKIESKDIWLVKTKKNFYMVEELEEDDEIDEITIEDEINGRFRPEYMPSWKLYYNYIGYHNIGTIDSDKRQFSYQLIFVFSTGTLDELSCALICDLFLNVLDCALKDVPLQCFSHFKMYDVGIKLESNVNVAIHHMISDKDFQRHLNKALMMSKVPRSNFDFKKRVFKDKDLKFKTSKCFFTCYDTYYFLKYCEKENVGVYAVFIAIINNALLHHAVKNGFKGIFRTRVLNIINAKFIFGEEDKKYLCKLGSHSVPYIQNFKLESTDIKEIFKEADRIERELVKLTIQKKFWDQEALRELYIKESGNKYNTGKWNSNYCFSVTNLGDLDHFYVPENPNDGIRLVSYDRASSSLVGGNLDVVFHILRGTLNVYFDYSNEYFSDKEMSNIMITFKGVIESLADKFLN